MNMEDMVAVSAGDHIVGPPTMFDQHVDKAHRGLTPEYIMDKDGNALWHWAQENKRSANAGLNAVVGRPREEYGMEPTNTQQMRPGAWDPKAHNDDMNVAGVLMSVQFPTFPGFDGSWFWNAKDKKNAERVVSAYNDWHIDEWCGPYKGRYIPTAVLPLWSIEATASELKRLINQGCRSVTFPSNPSIKGMPPPVHDEYWEPLWKLRHEEHVVLNCHIGAGRAPTFASMQSPISAWISALPMAIASDAADLPHLRALQRYSNLKFSLSEGGIGWIPHLLERCDFTYKHHGPWVRVDWGGRLPSEVFREHFLSCFIDDKFGCRHYDEVGEDIISYELDYPHSDCTWPLVAEELWDNVTDLSTPIIDKISHANAFGFFNVNPFEALGGRQNCTVGALRAKAKHVDTATRSMDGKDAPVQGDLTKLVTAADVWSPWANVEPEHGQLAARRRRPPPDSSLTTTAPGAHRPRRPRRVRLVSADPPRRRPALRGRNGARQGGAQMSGAPGSGIWTRFSSICRTRRPSWSAAPRGWARRSPASSRPVARRC